MGLVAFDGKLYAIGGRVDTPAHNAAYTDIYDPRDNSWTQGAPMPTARSGMAVATDGGKIFALGGEQSGMTDAFNNNEAYDPATNRWSVYAPLPEDATAPEPRRSSAASTYPPARRCPAAAAKAIHC